jgi:ribonuclease HII
MRLGILRKERARLLAMSLFEQKARAQGFVRVAGVDEAGRGPLAGPVVAAACILPREVYFQDLNDSKQLSPLQREKLFAQITTSPDVSFAIGEASVEEIDRINILQATFLAMQRAVSALAVPPDYLLIDGNQLPRFSIQAEAIVEGDAKSVSIAAASVLAKVTRDRCMVAWDEKWPQYGFGQHKGYGTAQHLQALRQYGPCPIHRRSFSPVQG